MELIMVIVVGVFCFLMFSHTYFFYYVLRHLVKEERPQAYLHCKRVTAALFVTTLILVIVEAVLLTRLILGIT